MERLARNSLHVPNAPYPLMSYQPISSNMDEEQGCEGDSLNIM
jgi:hypothetical protein